MKFEELYLCSFYFDFAALLYFLAETQPKQMTS